MEHVLLWVGVGLDIEFHSVVGFYSGDSKVPNCINRCSCWRDVQMKARNLTDVLSSVGSNQGLGDKAGEPPKPKLLPEITGFHLHIGFAAAFQLGPVAAVFSDV